MSTQPLDLPADLSRGKACELLADPETQAFTCLVAAAALLGEDALVDPDGQFHDEEELLTMLQQEGCEPHAESITRIVGLLAATTGDEFTEDPTHFHRMCSAIADGDPFAREDDGDPLTLADVYWAVYQTGLVTDENEPMDALGPRVERFLEDLRADEAEDNEALRAAIAAGDEPADEMQAYFQRYLVFRRGQIASDLVRLGCEADWMTPIDPELAGMMAAFKD